MIQKVSTEHKKSSSGSAFPANVLSTLFGDVDDSIVDDMSPGEQAAFKKLQFAHLEFHLSNKQRNELLHTFRSQELTFTKQQTACIAELQRGIEETARDLSALSVSVHALSQAQLLESRQVQSLQQVQKHSRGSSSSPDIADEALFGCQSTLPLSDALLNAVEKKKADIQHIVSDFQSKMEILNPFQRAFVDSSRCLDIVEKYGQNEAKHAVLPAGHCARVFMAIEEAEEAGLSISKHTTVATPEADTVRSSYIISGSKIVRGRFYEHFGAEYLLLSAKTRVVRRGEEDLAFSLFLVDALSPGLTVRIHDSKERATVILDQVTVPAAFLIGDKHQGLLHIKHQLESERQKKNAAVTLNRVVTYQERTLHTVKNRIGGAKERLRFYRTRKSQPLLPQNSLAVVRPDFNDLLSAEKVSTFTPSRRQEDTVALGDNLSLLETPRGDVSYRVISPQQKAGLRSSSNTNSRMSPARPKAGTQASLRNQFPDMFRSPGMPIAPQQSLSATSNSQQQSFTVKLEEPATPDTTKNRSRFSVSSPQKGPDFGASPKTFISPHKLAEVIRTSQSLQPALSAQPTRSTHSPESKKQSTPREVFPASAQTAVKDARLALKEEGDALKKALEEKLKCLSPMPAAFTYPPQVPVHSAPEVPFDTSTSTRLESGSTTFPMVSEQKTSKAVSDAAKSAAFKPPAPQPSDSKSSASPKSLSFATQPVSLGASQLSSKTVSSPSLTSFTGSFTKVDPGLSAPVLSLDTSVKLPGSTEPAVKPSSSFQEARCIYLMFYF